MFSSNVIGNVGDRLVIVYSFVSCSDNNSVRLLWVMLWFVLGLVSYMVGSIVVVISEVVRV